MARNGKEPATQPTLRGDPTPSIEADSRGSREPERQEVAETPAEDTTERPDETQTEVHVEPAKTGRGPVGDPTGNSAGGPVGGPDGGSTGGAQSRPQRDVDAMEVDVPEVPDPRIVEINADPKSTNRVDGSSDSDSDSEMRARVAYLEKKREKAKLKARLERLEREMAAGFVDERQQMDDDEHARQLSLERSKRVRDPDVYTATSQRQLTTYLTQVNDVFRQKPITYLTDMDKVLFAANFLGGVIRAEWKAKMNESQRTLRANILLRGTANFCRNECGPPT